MSLTPKQEKFAQCIADGMSQADAYRASFDCKKSKNETIWKRASELVGNGAVSGRIAELRTKLEKKTLWTREMSVKALIGAYKEGKPSEKIAAVKELNLMHGYNIPLADDANTSKANAIEFRVIQSCQ